MGPWPLLALCAAQLAGACTSPSSFPAQATLPRRLLHTHPLRQDAPCPALPALAPLPAQPSPALAAALATLASLLDASLNATTLPGGALLVSYGSTPLLTHYAGTADKASGTPVSAATLFRIASVSKVFPALLLYQMVDAGYLGLDDALATQLPFAMRNPFDAAQVTFRQLASHTAGLPREAPPGNTTADVLAALAPQYLILPPGALPSYSNLGFALLGHALAEGAAPTPTTLPQLVAQAILAPLNLTRTGYDYTPAVLAHLATGYAASGEPVPFADLGWVFPAGSMYSTPQDLLALAQALQQVGAGAGALGLSASRARELLTPLYWNRDGASLFGTPWECRASHSHLQLTKGGNLPGYTASLALVPSLTLSVAVAWNGGGVNEIDFMDSVMGVLLPALDAALAEAAPTPLYPPGPSPSDYVGSYALGGGGSVVSVSLAQGMLVWREQGALGVSFYLEWFRADAELGDLFRVAFPDSAFSCLLGEMEALRYQYVTFSRDCETGGVSGTAVPGWVPGAQWQRQP